MKVHNLGPSVVLGCHGAGLTSCRLAAVRWAMTMNFENGRIWEEIQLVQAGPSLQELSIEF